MKIVVGLGNPGVVYENTRHNVGFAIIKNLSEVLRCPNFSLKKKMKSEVCKVDQNIFVMPQTFMNGSGFAIKSIIDYYHEDKNDTNLQDLYIIHDDLDIVLGEYKIQFGIGPAAHNGLLSIYQHLKTKNFWHVRVGVDNRGGDRSIPAESYVLQKFSPLEIEKINTLKPEIVRKLIAIIKN
ncbi:MAG: aminoacyl-tRNA hydrolase [Pseudomonadales bacterium]|nr:aminoacyl-tRNA hydrolase [Pseudomonadales bacterium]